MAKKPSTIVGIPAIVSSIGLTMLRVRGRRVLGEEDRDSRPSGIAMTMRDDRDEQRPATRAAATPNGYGLIEADQTVPVKKSIGLTSWKNSSVS